MRTSPTPAGMRRVPINPPRGHDPEQHKIVGEIHSWDPPPPPHRDDSLDLSKTKDGVLYCSTGKPCTYPACAPAPCADRLLAHLNSQKERLENQRPDG
jgi:hypothetical protein